MPEIGLDYACLRESDSDETLTVLVMKDRDSKTMSADGVELKGRRLEGTVEDVVRNIARLGYKKVILCSVRNLQSWTSLRGSLQQERSPPFHRILRLGSLSLMDSWEEPSGL